MDDLIAINRPEGDRLYRVDLIGYCELEIIWDFGFGTWDFPKGRRDEILVSQYIIL
jgi:hypothetical protein